MSNESVQSVLDATGPKVDGIERDRWGRYVLADPETGEIKSWTRVTTLSNIVNDKSNITTWEKRHLALGIGRREDLYAMAASVATATEPNDRQLLDQVITAATEASAQPAKANLGTALHGFTERLDLGETNVDEIVPETWRQDVRAYLDAMKLADLWPYERFIETVLIIPELGAAGTVDRLLASSAFELPRIGDLKTGSVEGKGLSFAVQLSAYAHATHWYDPKTKTYHEMPAVDQTTGIVMHLPVGQGRCDLFEIDLVAGWEAAQTAHAVQQWRKHASFSVPMGFGNMEPVTIDHRALKDEPVPTEKTKRKTTKAKSTKSKTRTVEDANDIATVTPEPTERKCITCGDTVPVADYAAHTDKHLFDARFAWSLARVKYLAIEHNQGQELGEVWANACTGIPTFKQGGPRTHEEIDRVAGACALVEMAHTVPFFEPDPAKEKSTICKWLPGGSENHDQHSITE